MHTFFLESLEFLILVAQWSSTHLEHILELLLLGVFSKRDTLTTQLKVRSHDLNGCLDSRPLNRREPGEMAKNICYKAVKEAYLE